MDNGQIQRGGGTDVPGTMCDASFFSVIVDLKMRLDFGIYLFSWPSCGYDDIAPFTLLLPVFPHSVAASVPTLGNHTHLYQSKSK